MNRWHHAVFSFLLLLIATSNHVHAQSDVSNSATQPNCSGDALISETFSNGAKWQMCWESRIRENLVLSDVYYTPPNGESKRILSTARLSQLHVAYDDSDVTYNDITQYGLGGGYLVTLDETDCPYGDLLIVQTRPTICRWRSEGQDNYRTATRAVSAESLTLFSVSQVGAYAYIVTWKFFSDGAIEPQIGASGALQRSSDNTQLPYGRVLHGDEDTLWLSHTHNYYWRLDFDLGTNANDDVVTESRTQLTASGTRQTSVEKFTTEQSRKIDSDIPIAWAIWEDLEEEQPTARDSGYRIEPIRYGHRLERAEKEPYTQFDFFVTVANECERFASQNARFNPDCLNHVGQYANGESLQGADIVLWHRVGFHHIPRNEDQRHMHTHWDGFAIEPVNIHASTPGINVSENSAPQIQTIEDQSSNQGLRIEWQLAASDTDGDETIFSAVNLPQGLQISTSGRLFGSTETPGDYDVRISVSDDIATSQQQFNWSVSGEVTKGDKKGFLGAISPTYMALLLMLWVRTITQFNSSGSVRD